MKISGCRLEKQIVFCLTIFLAMPLAHAVAVPPQQAPDGQETQSVSSPQTDSGSQASDIQKKKVDADTIPDGAAIPESPTPVRSQAANQNEQSTPSQSVLDQQGGEAKPVGAAAAPYEKTTGVAASRPAGAAIAPAKQRRARSILIKVGVVVGAAVAVGTVVALSHGSPSRPN